MNNRYVLRFGVEPAIPYRDPISIRWNVFDMTTKKRVQDGSLHVDNKSDFGPMRDVNDHPEVLHSDIDRTDLMDTECKNDRHVRSFFWNVLCLWKERDPDLFILTSGGWASWSHLMHRMIHDDLNDRCHLDLRNIMDMDVWLNLTKMNKREDFRHAFDTSIRSITKT